MRPGDSCWTCKNLISEVHGRPPVYCRAFPDGLGIPFEILAGIVRHDRILGNEKNPVFYEPKKERG